jgi:hypothetical protein
MSAGSPRLALWIWLVAALLTALNVSKPLTIDDPAYYRFAEQIAADPADPYGFEMFWNEAPQRAIEILAPPGLPYWWALGITLFGDSPWAWKLWLFPYALLLSWAVCRLLQRFAPGAEAPLLAAIVLSPTILPAFNLMIDVPSLALGLGAVTIFVRACDSDRTSLALLAGAVAGLACQTKYTAFAPTAAMLVHGLLTRRWSMVLVAGSVAAVLFVGWEIFTYQRYGDSHFILALSAPRMTESATTLWGWIESWIALFGALGVPAALLALLTLRPTPRWLAASIALGFVPFALVALLDPPTLPPNFEYRGIGKGDQTLNIFFASGLAVVVTISTGLIVAARRKRWTLERDSWLLLAWLAIELIVCFAASPFPASRRLMGPLLVASLAIVHFARPLAPRARATRWIAAASVALGLVFGIADLLDARARHSLQPLIAEELARQGYDSAKERVWYTGHWGFQFYAEQRGYRPLIAGGNRPRPGDWIVLTSSSTAQDPSAPMSRVVSELYVSSPFPLSTTPSGYMSAAAIRRQPLSQNRAYIYRATLTDSRPHLRALRPPQPLRDSRGL